ncbi:hypothetical protein BZL43_23835 [Pseudomonas sp. PICF141]|nr:hypothetical protein BZL43_23835 [Pseudomonas sp. PICF141]
MRGVFRLERGFTGLWRRKFFFRLFWLVFDGEGWVFARLGSAVMLQARWGGPFSVFVGGIVCSFWLKMFLE